MCSEGAAGDADGERWESRIGWVLIAGVRTCGITGDLKFFLYVLRLWDVNCTVVCQVDRLNRFLPDFSRIVDLPDRHRATFAAVTLVQPHILARRLKLNILLSFAHGNQFHWLLLPKVPLVAAAKGKPPIKGICVPPTQRRHSELLAIVTRGNSLLQTPHAPACEYHRTPRAIT